MFSNFLRSTTKAVVASLLIACGELPARAVQAEVVYYHQDALGSTRLVTDEDGDVASRSDYLPFGEEIEAGTFGRDSILKYGAANELRHRFTDKERDEESGLDYFGARYYSGAQGRFASPDEPLTYSDESDPQSWNLYTYTGNNPLNRVDPDGHDWFYASGESPIWIDCQKGGACASPPPEGFTRWDGTGDSVFVSTHHGTYTLKGNRPDAFVFDGFTQDISWETANQVLLVYGVARVGIGAVRWGFTAWAGRQAGAEVGVAVTRPLMRSLGSGGDDMLLNKAVNSNLPHAVKRGVERAVFASKEEAATALRSLTAKLTSSGAFPKGTLVDTANKGRFLVPIGNNGLAVYELAANGTAKLKTVLIAR